MNPTNPFTAADLASAHETNTLIFNESDDGPGDWAHRAVQTALSAPVPDELLDTNVNTPLLRWADRDVPAVGLLDAMLNPPRHRAKTCDRCSNRLGRGVAVHRMWVPCGQSAVELQFCWHCHNVLNDVYRQGSEHVLVWV